jgi:hypothetical protein
MVGTDKMIKDAELPVIIKKERENIKKIKLVNR